MKRIISITLIVFLITLGLTSCRKPENSKNGNNLTPTAIHLAEI